jgi:hypothetical protein
MKVGDIVIPNDPAYPLRSGSSAYTHAIVVQEQPLVLVSVEADMRWEVTVKPDKLKVIGVADPEQLKICMTRLEK